MIDRYSYGDPIIKDDGETPNLKVENGRSILKIFRLIGGTINCEDQYLEKKYKFRENYIVLPSTKTTKLKTSSILRSFPEEVKPTDLDNYFMKSMSNSKFYDSILSELIRCLIAQQEKKFLESFFYLYRILEGISYSIPLLYVSRSKEYNKTFDSLKSFFTDKSDEELAFLKNFIQVIFRDEDFFKSSVSINLDNIDIEEAVPEYYKIYLSLVMDKKTNPVKDYVENSSIDFTFVGYYEFMIELRNRFFHNKKGGWKENLDTTKVIYPDLFFKPIIGPGINWISIILFEIIKNDFEHIR